MTTISQLLEIKDYSQIRRENNARMAILWQKISAEAYSSARMYYDRGAYRHAAYYQRQGARDHKMMQSYLERAL